MCFFLSAFTAVEAQQFFFKNYSVESGLPFVQVACMYQDDKGYLWSGGYGGLSRFDGKTFLNYNRKHGLIDRNVNAICTDETGAVFIATNKGLSVLKDKRFVNYSQPEGLLSPYVNALCRRDGRSVYLGTSNGLYLFSAQVISRVPVLDGFRISCLLRSDSTLLYAGTDKGLAVYEGGRCKILTSKDGLVADQVNCMAWYKNQLVIGTSGGLSLYDPRTGKFTNYHIETGLIDLNITAVSNQGNRYLWVGAQTGLLRFDGEQFAYFNIGPDNNSNHVRAILPDREDNIWLGTHSGLYRYRDNSFSTFDKIPGLGTSFIFQIFRDRRGDLWVTSQNSGIYRETQNYFRRYDARDGLVSNTIRSGIEDHEGRLLFGTEDGLVQFRRERFEKIVLPVAFRPPYNVLFLDSRKTLWIGGKNGVAALTWKNNTPQVRFYSIPSRVDFTVYGLCEGDQQAIYIGTDRAGLYKLQGDSLSSLNLSEETFFMMRYIKGRVFAASLNGLLVLDTKTNALSRITDAEGLNSELLYAIELADHQNTLWIGTNQGINKLNLKKYLSEGKIDLVSYGQKEGFVGVECNSNGIWEDKDGTLWFGTVNGLIQHQPFHFRKNPVENITLIENIRLMNEDTLISDGCELPSHYNTIAFYYRGICLTNPDKVLYQKKLEGLDEDKEWSTPSPEDYSKYANLAPGRYTFKVRSCNNEGVWNSEETRFSFTIRAPFYRTWWFLLSACLLAFALVYSLFMLRIYNIKKKQRLDFDRKVEMSKIELKALRSQMNPHFVFNSLNAIQHYIFNTRGEEAIKYLNKFARLVRIILNNSEKPTVTVGDDLEALRLYLELEQMRFEDKFDYEIIVDESLDVDYDIMPPLLMQPYVENAILHGLNPKPVKGKLTIRLHSENNFLICTIVDDGIGREKASEIRRTMPVRNHKSLGMKITEDRLRILNEINHSQLSVTITDLKDADGRPQGTKVELFVPLTG